MTELERCPNCGSAKKRIKGLDSIRFECGSQLFPKTGGFYPSKQCQAAAIEAEEGEGEGKLDED